MIIPTYTKARWDWLHECVASVQAQSVTALEIIVVVDHNPELLGEITSEFPDVIAVPNIGGRGVSGARNSGVKASRGEVVAFLDDDCEPEPAWAFVWLPGAAPVRAPGAIRGAGGHGAHACAPDAPSLRKRAWRPAS